MQAPETVVDPYRVLQVLPTAEQEVLDAAFRALARKYHPDRDASAAAAFRMRELNLAYALVREPAIRAAHDRARRGASGAAPTGEMASGAPRAAGPAVRTGGSEAAGTRLPFGRYAGWSLREVAGHDPEYLLWLSRHSSGMRYRTEIYGILRALGNPAA